MKRILTAVFLLAFAAPALAQAEKQPEKLGVGDAIRVTVFQQPDLTTEVRISERGTISMPLIGETTVGGLTQAEAAGAIRDGLKKGKFLKDPQVAVSLTTLRSRQVSVLGLVARPGRVALDGTSSQLADVIAASGGITTGGSDTVVVLREGKEHKVNVLKPFALEPGDTINVERAPVVYIYGEVTRGGAYPVVPDMTVMQAIAAGGGITPRGSERRVKLRRPDGGGKYIETDAKLQDRVKADDVIFVKEALF
jgi:polysaccharide export outer membrane protein